MMSGLQARCYNNGPLFVSRQRPQRTYVPCVVHFVILTSLVVSRTFTSFVCSSPLLHFGFVLLAVFIHLNDVKDPSAILTS